jgi:hypothetical protein
MPTGGGYIIKDMRDMNLSFVRHGFSSSFNDWAVEKMPSVPETALAHVISYKVQRAYRRTQFLDMRLLQSVFKRA